MVQLFSSKSFAVYLENKVITEVKEVTFLLERRKKGEKEKRLLPHWPTPTGQEQSDVPWLRSSTFIITKKQQRSKQKKHDPQRQTEGGEGELDQASQDMLMSLMTLPWVVYGRLGVVKTALLRRLQTSI